MIDTIRFLFAAILMIGGVLAGAVSILGVFRFRFVMNRMHSAAILDTVAMAGILGGLMVASSSWQFIPKLIAALLVLWIGSPAASHLVGRMELSTDETATSHLEVEDNSNESN